MTIDTHTIGLASIQSSTTRDVSGAALRTATDTNRHPSEVTGQDAASSPASVVSISDAARLAAQGSDAQQQAGPAQEEARRPAVVSADYLDRLLIDMLSAQKFLGISAADLQAARASGANSDLL